MRMRIICACILHVHVLGTGFSQKLKIFSQNWPINFMRAGHVYHVQAVSYINKFAQTKTSLPALFLCFGRRSYSSSLISSPIFGDRGMPTGSCRTAAGIKLDTNSHFPTHSRTSDLCWYSTGKVTEHGCGSCNSSNCWRVSCFLKL